MTPEELSKISRLEIITENGRKLVKYLKGDEKLEFSVQDGGRTLKIFIEKDEDIVNFLD